MTRSITPAIETINNSTSTQVVYDATVTVGQTPPMSNPKAAQAVTVVYPAE